MHKRLNGYLTVEASWILPITLALFLLLFRSSFFLYNRTAYSHLLYRTAFRQCRWTQDMEDAAEVLYGEISLEDGICREWTDRPGGKGLVKEAEKLDFLRILTEK